MAPFGLGRQKSALYLIAIVLTVFGSETNTSTESDKTLCYDRNNTAVPSGERFIPVRGDPCRICLCDKGFAVMCSSVACYPPNNCYQPRLLPDTCCEYSCSPPTPTPPPGHNETIHPDSGNTDVSINSLGLRLAASAITSFLVLTLLLFMVHRLRRRRLLLSMRRHEAHTRCPHMEDCESDIFVDNMMAIPCPPYMDPPPPYSPPKPPHRIFPNEAPPPYEPFDTSARQSVQNSTDTSTTSSSPAGTADEGRPGVAREGERPAPGTVSICSAREGVVTFTNGSVQEARQPDPGAASARRMESVQRQAPSSQGDSLGVEESPSRGTECGAAVALERRISRRPSMESPDHSSPSRRQRQGGRRRSHVDSGSSLVDSSCSGESSLSNLPEDNSAQTVSSTASPREGRERECRPDARKKSSTRNSGSQDVARGGSRDRSKTKRNSVGSGQSQSVSQSVIPASGACSSSWHQGCSSWNDSAPTMSQSAHEENAVCTCESSPPRLPPNPLGSQGNQQSLASLRLSALLGSDNGLEELDNMPRASDLPSGNELLPRSQSVNSEVSALSVCSETGETRRSRSTALRNDLPYPEYPHGFLSSPTRRRLPQASAARSLREMAAVAAEETVSSGAGHQNGLEAQPGSSQITGASSSGSSGRNAGQPGQASSAGTSETMNPEQQKKKKSRGKSSRHSTGSLPHARTKGKTVGVWPCGSTSRHSGAALDSPSFSRANDKASPKKRDSPKKADPAIKQYGYIDNPQATRKHSVGSQWPSGIRQLLSPGESSQSPKKVKSTYSQAGPGVLPAGQPDPRQAALVLGLEAVQAAQSMSNARRQNKKRMSYPNSAGGVPITLERIAPGDRAAMPSVASTLPRPRLAPEASAQASVTDLSDRYPQLSAAERQGIQASYIHPSELPESFPSQLKVRGSYV